ncbi:MAG: FG-GAP-like repeat-containing protein [Planctomycetaceae bacterium]
MNRPEKSSGAARRRQNPPWLLKAGLFATATLLLAGTGCDSETTTSGPSTADGPAKSVVAGKDEAAESASPDVPDDAPAGAAADRLPELFTAPEFELTDQNGGAFASSELEGRVWIANFVFTRCASTCPRQTQALAELQRQILRWPGGDRVRLLSFSVDPEFDTPQVLREYAERYGADQNQWKFLTGSRADIWSISGDGFKLPVSEAAADSAMPITHSPRFILVDARGKVRGFYDSQSADEIRQLRHHLRKLLSEDSGDPDQVTHVGVPPDVFDPDWLESRRAEQLATADESNVFKGFHLTDRVEDSGITFVSHATMDAGKFWKPNHYDHGNGLAVADVDGDGRKDVYFVSQVGPNELWRNLGNGRFENITAEADVALEQRISISASFADTDNDGDQDLMVTTVRHGNVFFENDGSGNFRDATEDSGLSYTGHSSSVEFFDYDRDGLLDVFLTNVGVYTTDEVAWNGDPDQQQYPYFVGIRDAFGGHLFPSKSERSILYRNLGENRFQDVSEETGLVDVSWSGDATPLDVNGDGWTDLYLTSMQGNDEYYENVEGQRFERRSREVFPKTPWGAMGVKSFDYNNDGRMDLLITDMHSDMWELSKNILGSDEKLRPGDTVMPESYLKTDGHSIFGNALFRNEGDGVFRDVALETNTENFWPWGVSVGDLNADGFQDVLMCSCMNLPFRYHVNSLLLNDAGERFVDAEFIVGIEPRRDGRTAAVWYELDCSGADADHDMCRDRTGRVVVWGALGTRSAAIFDLDDDGDLDIVTNDFNSQPMVLISDLSTANPDRSYLAIDLQGTKSNRNGLGARVQVTVSNRVLTQVQDGQSGYLSQSVLPLYFGLDGSDVVDEIAIEWPSGTRQVVPGPVSVNQQLTIQETP